MRRFGKLLQPWDGKGINWRNAGILAVLLPITIALSIHVYRTPFIEARGRDQAIETRIDNLQMQLDELKKTSSVRVRVTAYQSEARQTDGTPRITAINKRCRPGTIAVSRDLLEAGWTFGKRVWIEGYGVYVIEDVMNRRAVQSIDIWVPRSARTFCERNVLAALVMG